MACTRNSGAPEISHVSLPADAPDLSLSGVAFARLSEGRLAARGTAVHLDYRRAGGRLIARQGAATLFPEPGTGLASFGRLELSAPDVAGEIANRHGTATGGVTLDTGRGDHAFTDAATYDGATVRSDTRVVAHGPGYKVQGAGMVAQADGSSVLLTRGVTGQMQMEAGR
jgi:lipopolysaccharide export system protein LptC